MAEESERYFCDFCGSETDAYRFCMNCGKRMCWNCVGRINISVHFSDGRRETSLYVCQNCMNTNSVNIRELLEKKFQENEYPSIKKMIERVKSEENST